MSYKFQGLINSLSLLSNEVRLVAGGITGIGVGLEEAASQPSLSSQMLLFPSVFDLSVQIFMVFFFGAIGALGAAFINWLLIKLTNKKDPEV